MGLSHEHGAREFRFGLCEAYPGRMRVYTPNELRWFLEGVDSALGLTRDSYAGAADAAPGSRISWSLYWSW